MTRDSGPDSLVGTELSGVAFVRDYVEFHFDGAVLRSLTDPIVGDSPAQVHRDDPGWRDALCALIGASVQGVAVVDGVSIDIVFTGDRRLRVPLDDDARVGPEAAHFLPDDWPDARMWVY